MSRRPIQCSDDIKGQGDYPPVFQTGQEVVPSCPRHAETLQTDAELASQPLQEREGQARTPNTTTNKADSPDVVKIQSERFSIEATGLARSLKPGATLILGGETNTTIVKGQPVVSYSKPMTFANKNPLTKSGRPPTQRELDILCENLNNEWKTLGRHLKLEDPLLDHIGQDFKSDGQHEINYRVLKKWKETFPEHYTVAVLAEVLSLIGRGDLADELQG